MYFGFVEKVQVVVHGLPVFNHSGDPPCSFKCCAGVAQNIFLTTRGAFGDCRIRSPNAPAHFGVYVNSFLEIY